MFGQTTFDQPWDSSSAPRSGAGRRPGSAAGIVLALVAVLLLNWANARSATMQLAALAAVAGGMEADMPMPAGSAAMPGCPDMAMPSASRAGMPVGEPQQPAHHQAPCEVCAVAAHLPVPVLLPPAVRFRAAWTVAFLHAQAMHPRGPPAFRARARSPPAPVCYA